MSIGGVGHSGRVSVLARAEVKPTPRHFTVMERIFRTCVFQYAVQGILEAIIRFFYIVFSQRTCCLSCIDPAREERSLTVFKDLGGKELSLEPIDGGAKIHTMVLSWEALDKKIKSYGAQWDKIELPDKRTIFAVMPPTDAYHWSRWQLFYANALCKMGWRSEVITHEGKQKEVLITCENGDLVGSEKYCFLDCHPNGRSFLHDRRRAGFYLGMKCDVVLYDQRGLTRSPGIAGEGAHYLDVMCVFAHIRDQLHYSASRICVAGRCGGVAVAAYLKRVHHDGGIHFVEENGHLGLVEDVVEDLPPFWRWLGRKQLDALSSTEIPEAIRPTEDRFNTREKFTGLSSNGHGHFIGIHPIKEKSNPCSAASRFEEIAKKVNAHTAFLYYTPQKGGDGRSENPLEQAPFRRAYTGALFGVSS